MQEMDRMEEYDYRDNRGGNNREGNYRGGNYRDDYREDYRGDYRGYRDDYRQSYRDEYGRNQRDRYGRNRRNYRNYRSQEEYTMMLEDTIDDSMELSRAYEDLSEMTNNSNEKQKLMKMAEREKEHYKTAKEILQNHM